MTLTRRIFVSMPADRWLDAAQNDLKWGIVERIEQLGYVPEIFLDPTGRNSLAAPYAWSAERAEDVARRCHGACLIGLPRWTLGASDGTMLLPTDYSQYEGAVARTIALPLLIVVQDNLVRRVVFDPSFGPYIGVFPAGADRTWVSGKQFETTFGYWRSRLAERRDIFLGYCGASTDLALKLRLFLEKDLGATVLDWQRDFKPGRSILDEIEEARVRCTAGIFLFTKDDLLADPGRGREASPRDNVVFEAGYFASAKKKDRVLIVRESGAKIPADLGGDIYASLEDRADLTQVTETVRRFLSNL